MLVIEVELLTGRYAATAHNDRTRAEWPPHPARFFSALVSALHEIDPVDSGEREALTWLEQREAPSLAVDLKVDERVGRRQVMDVYVPVNDVSTVAAITKGESQLRQARARFISIEAVARTQDTDVKAVKKAKGDVDKAEKKLQQLLAAQETIDPKPSAKDIDAAGALIPDGRTRQVRTFPVVLPSQKTFTFIWGDQPTEHVREALDRLCERVTRLGHSSSLVRCAVIDAHPDPTLIPTENGDHVLRVVGPGQLRRLEQAFEQHKGVESRVLPARPQRYGEPRRGPEGSPFASSVFSGDWIVFERIGGARPLSSRGTEYARALRAAMIEQAGTPTLSPVLSGHDEKGGPAEQAHVVFTALPYVGSEHADGSVQGCAIILAANASGKDRETVLKLIAALEKTRAVDATGAVELAASGLPAVLFRRVELSEKWTLNPWRWRRPSRRFVTATPIALDRNPGNLRSNLAATAKKAAVEARATIADACERIGLPRPLQVEISFGPLLAGAQHARAFRPWPDRPGRPPRVRVHAEITFAEYVRGPLLLGAGRYFGLGLALPLPEGNQ